MDVTHRDTVTVTGVVLDQTGQPVTRGTVQSRARTVLGKVAQDAARIAGISRATTWTTSTRTAQVRQPIPWATIRAWAAWATKAAVVLLVLAVVATAWTLLAGASTLGRVAIAVGACWPLVIRWVLSSGWQRATTPRAPRRRPTPPTAPDPAITVTCTVTDRPCARRALTGRRQITH